MKIIADTKDAQYHLELRTEDGTILAIAGAQGGPIPPAKFLIWEGDPWANDDPDLDEEQSAVQVHTVKQGQTADQVWEQVVEFEAYRVALAEWGRLRDQEARVKRFDSYIEKAQQYVESISRYLDLKFELHGDEEITAEVSGYMQALLGHLKEADDLADHIQDA